MVLPMDYTNGADFQKRKSFSSSIFDYEDEEEDDIITLAAF
jgi:hypothetical protein